MQPGATVSANLSGSRESKGRDLSETSIEINERNRLQEPLRQSAEMEAVPQLLNLNPVVAGTQKMLRRVITETSNFREFLVLFCWLSG